ncbi:restriction endonuclease subunit S [Helicobacter pylori]|uniref:restriction endonuclease subunit S n=1 Tax=Helicobacter pylori TaxID=210 RepID=UPI000681FE81|nr:restriction endonuclease subunit S [Helicobacter pylori]KNE07136.1 type II restriction endonuclease [Helicobacter pylori]
MIGPLSSQLNAIKWGEFKLGDLFEVLSSKKIYHANTIKIHDTQIENSYPYVVRATTNNGIKGFIIDDPTFTNEKNTLSFAQDTFTVFYQKQPYFTGNKVKILKPKFAFKSPKILHFISAILQFILKPLTWGLGSTTESIAEFKFSLPLKPTANAQTLEDIDFDFMEKFIAELEQCRLAELEQCRLAELQAYLKAAGLENTTLSGGEENALNLFNNSLGGNTGLRWQSFRLGDLFEIRPTKAYNLTNSHLFDSNAKNPVVTNSSLNNGISGYSSLEPTEKGNQITYSDTTTSEGIFYQKRPFIGYSHVQGLYPLKYHEFWNEKTLLYIVVAFKKVACGRFNYGNKFNRKIASEMLILLPTDQHGKIDFPFMRTLINALMKQTIQGVAEYCDAKIQAAKEVISQETPTPKDSLF